MCLVIREKRRDEERSHHSIQESESDDCACDESTDGDNSEHEREKIYFEKLRKKKYFNPNSKFCEKKYYG